jgi:arylsulfatase A-like enzyme
MPSTDKQPNIVLITAIHSRGDCLGCARSNPPVMTPHLDQIAAKGVRFTQAYAERWVI